jgi:O-antigen/teichoic acid export membrane protein
MAAAGWLEYGLQLLVPVVLVRYLAKSEVGVYRGVWLFAATATAVLPLYLPQSLLYFVPRSTPSEANRYVAATLLYLTLAGAALAGIGLIIPPALLDVLPVEVNDRPWFWLFIGLWLIAVLADYVCLAFGKPLVHARAVSVLAVARTCLVGGAAILLGGITPVLAALCAFAALKCMFIPIIHPQVTEGIRGVDARLLRSQWRYSLPFALSSGLFRLRLQADQWIVAALFSVEVFATFSIAAVAAGVSNLVRQPLLNTYIPIISGHVGAGRTEEAVRAIKHSFSAVTITLVPLIGLLLIAVPGAVELVYTRSFLDAAPVMQLYVGAQLICIFGGGHLLPILGQGKVAAVINGLQFAIAVVVGVVGAITIGPVGAAAGSTVALVFGEFVGLIMAARLMGVALDALINKELAARVLAVCGAGMLAAFSIGRFSFQLEQAPVRLVVSCATYLGVVSVGVLMSGLGPLVRAALSSRSGEV